MQKCFALFLFLGTVCQAQMINETGSSFVYKKYSAKIAKARLLVDSLMKGKRIPGLSICVAKGNQIIWAQGFGYADIENNTPVTLQSRFRIGSISKTLTALALGKLIDENAIHLSDPIQKYVPYFPEKKYPVTL
jgi:serine beta-lactamase-like protein LACTB, mitochondrial